MAQDNKPKITFADLDNFLKIAPIIGLAILAYLQTLFPSKAEFKEIQTQLIQMDKKITEMTVLQKAITGNTCDICGNGSTYTFHCGVNVCKSTRSY